ncbi:MAG: hypothetical protein CL535_00415 [Ahrensia sp.]|nr:hypothetical protein [Ahrensia sp.]
MLTATRHGRTIGRSISSRFKAAQLPDRDFVHYWPAASMSPVSARATGKEGTGIRLNVAFR